MTTWVDLTVFEIRNGVTQIHINCICKILGEILIIRYLIIIEYGMFSTASLYYSVNNEYDIMAIHIIYINFVLELEKKI